MAAPPLRTEISDTYPNPNNDTARLGFGKFWDYVTGLLGATGNAGDARTALGANVEPGMVQYTAGSAAPTGWLKANGDAVSRTTYAALFAVIGTTYGAGDGSSTFNLPDLRGEFVRGLDDGRGVDSGRALGSAQSGQNASHTHTGSTDAQGAHSHGGSTTGVGDHTHTMGTTHSGNGYGGNDGWNDISNPGSGGAATGAAGAHSHSIATDTQGTHGHTVTIGSSGGAEARPRNVALLAIIKT